MTPFRNQGHSPHHISFHLCQDLHIIQHLATDK